MKWFLPALLLSLTVGGNAQARDEEAETRGKVALSTPEEAERAITSTRVLTRKEWLADPPRPLIRITPDYPLSAQRRGRTANVLVWFDVLGSGRTSNIEAAFDDEEREFAEAAIFAVERWIYESRVENGVGVIRSGVYVEMSFGIERPGAPCDAPEAQYDKPGVEQLVVCGSRVRRLR